MHILGHIYDPAGHNNLVDVPHKGVMNMRFYSFKVAQTGRTVVVCKHMERIPQLDASKTKVRHDFI